MDSRCRASTDSRGLRGGSAGLRWLKSQVTVGGPSAGQRILLPPPSQAGRTATMGVAGDVSRRFGAIRTNFRGTKKPGKRA